MTKAPDTESALVLMAFGALIVLWLMSGPVDAAMLAETILLPSVVAYDLGDQAAKGEGR